MAWDDTPPSAEELKTVQPAWDATPPTPEELGTSPGTSGVTAGATGIMQGATLGWAPALGSLGKTAMDAVTGVSGPLSPGGSLDDLVDEYRKNRDALRADFAKAASAHPHIALAGNLAGGAASLAAAGPAALSSKGLAATGAIQGLSGVDVNDLSDIPEAAKEAAIGAGTNLVAGKTLEAAAPYAGKLLAPVGNVISKAASVAGDFAGSIPKRVLSATLGPSVAAIDAYTSNPEAITNAVAFPDQADKLAEAANTLKQQILDGAESARSTLVDQAAMPKDQLISRLKALQDSIPIKGQLVGDADKQAFKKIGSIIESLEDLKPEPLEVTPPKTISAELPKPFNAETNPMGPNRGRIMQVQNQIDQANLSALNDAGFNPYEAPKDTSIAQNDLKSVIQRLDDNINWNDPSASRSNEILSKARTDLDGVLKDANPDYAKAMEPVADKSQMLQYLQQKYNLKTSPEGFVASDATASNLKNSLNANKGVSQGVLDKVKDATGYDALQAAKDYNNALQFQGSFANGSRRAVVGGSMGAALGHFTGIPGASYVGGALGAGVGAVADKEGGAWAKSILDATQAVKQKTPDALSSVLKSTPQAFGKFSSVLSNAAARGPLPERVAQMGEAGDAAAQANLASANEAGFDPYNPNPPIMDSEIPISKAEEIKRGYQGKVNWNSPQVENNANAIVSSGYREAVENAAGEADQEIGEQFLQDKKTYGLLTPVKEAAERRALTLQQSPAGGLLDTAAFGAGALAGSPAGLPGAVVGGVTGLVAKTLRPRYASMGAVTADALSDVLKKMPSAFGKFAPVLSSAAARGPISLNATDYVLSQTSQEYRDQKKSVFASGDEDSSEER